jgi:hypothetical protein
MIRVPENISHSTASSRMHHTAVRVLAASGAPSSNSVQIMLEEISIKADVAKYEYDRLHVTEQLSVSWCEHTLLVFEFVTLLSCDRNCPPLLPLTSCPQTSWTSFSGKTAGFTLQFS